MSRAGHVEGPPKILTDFVASVAAWAQKLRPKLPAKIRFCLASSFALMFVGHWSVMASGAVFNPQSGERYNLVTRWVSDFAAKWPEGLWVKAAIVFFCLALIGFFWLVIEKFASGRRTSMVWWSILAIGMIGGLLLVILFDMSAPQYALKKPSFLGRIFFQRNQWIQLPDGQIVWVKRWYHQLGFRLFVSSYFVAAFSLAAVQWRSTRRGELRKTVFLLLLIAASSVWLFTDQIKHAGISQRALLILIFVWLIRNLRTLNHQSHPEQSIGASKCLKLQTEKHISA